MIEIKKLESDKDAGLFEALLHVFAEVFAMEDFSTPSRGYMEKLLAQQRLIAYVVLHEGIVVGGLTAFELPLYYTEGTEVFLYDIGVQAEFQRKGLGKALLQALQSYCQEKGISSLFVAADEEDVHAMDFYRHTGGQEARVRHYSYTL